MYWEASWLESARIWYGCFILVYIAIIILVTIAVLTIVNIRNRQNNPLIPETDRPPAIHILNSGLDWRNKTVMIVAIVLLSTGIYLIVIESIF